MVFRNFNLLEYFHSEFLLLMSGVKYLILRELCSVSNVLEIYITAELPELNAKVILIFDTWMDNLLTHRIL